MKERAQQLIREPAFKCPRCNVPVKDQYCGWVVDECPLGKKESFAGAYEKSKGKVSIPGWARDTAESFMLANGYDPSSRNEKIVEFSRRMTVNQLAEKFCLTPERIGQILNAAVDPDS